MKRLTVCCDGTWNTPEQEENNQPAPTNVVRLFNAVAPKDEDGKEQRKYYHPGVGTEGGFFAQKAGGIYGAGMEKNIMSAYGWLARNYTKGDAIYLFGFSRGAYTARCIGGMMGKCGLPKLGAVSSGEGWKRVEATYQRGYKKGLPASDWRGRWAWTSPDDIPIEFIGVWDTVGALGVPDDLALLNLLDNPERWRFHDTRLGKGVKTARHAIAIDEMRANFAPTLWTDEDDKPVNDGKRVKQLWFSGVHSNVGGGYGNHELSDIPLMWMIEEAGAAKLNFEKRMLAPDQVAPNKRGVLHDSRRGMFAKLPTQPRCVPRFAQDSPDIHPSAVERHFVPPITQAPYHPLQALETKGQSVSVPIYALEEWNETGIYLEAGVKYDFKAAGQWLDKSVPCGPAGANDGEFHMGEVANLAGSLLGKLEGVFQRVSGNEAADFKFTRRVEEASWFSLIGIVADCGNPGPDGTLSEHTQLLIGKSLTGVTIKNSGYLHAFANDAWHFYGNNRGSVTLTVTRKS